SDLTDQIVRRSQQMGVRADQFAQQIVNSGQLGALMSEILRGKALALVLDRATVTDESGNPVDLDAIGRTAEALEDELDDEVDDDLDDGVDDDDEE
ncbi:MAG: trigger factor, partial [Frankiaceae bacterium]|nr:trigger factor [Frankiaceae bacterium]